MLLAFRWQKYNRWNNEAQDGVLKPLMCKCCNSKLKDALNG